MKSVLRRVFETPTDKLFGDLIRGKHGGVVILACGSPGVRKTLTAEVYAEMSRRPLYVLEFGELGTTVQEIEHNLERVFARVVRWRAVLQFDECEIFLSQRGNDLERSAIVGIFLRMLDYYEGLLFLTTNRADALDPAIRSRVVPGPGRGRAGGNLENDVRRRRPHAHPRQLPRPGGAGRERAGRSATSCGSPASCTRGVR